MKETASLILVRNRARPEFFWARRGDHDRFLSGFHVFPGGAVEATDVELGEGNPDLAARHAALRETFEEAGLILAYDCAGEMVSLASDKDYTRFQEYREPLHRHKLSLLEICQTENLKLAVEVLEKREGVAGTATPRLRWVDDAMGRRDQTVVGQPLQHVANIAHDGVFFIRS